MKSLLSEWVRTLRFGLVNRMFRNTEHILVQKSKEIQHWESGEFIKIGF